MTKTDDQAALQLQQSSALLHAEFRAWWRVERHSWFIRRPGVPEWELENEEWIEFKKARAKK